MAQRWGNNDGRLSMLLNVFAECEVKEDAKAVFTVLTSPPNSGLEKQQLGQLAQEHNACSEASNGVARTQSTSVLRARLALAMYRFVDLAGHRGAKAAG